MFWIVNTSLRREGGYESLIHQLDRQQVPYMLVRKPPFADYLIAMEDDFDEDGHQKPIKLNIEGPVFVTGTTSMKGVSLAHGWENPGPGYIDAPSQEECFAHWDREMLNRDAVFGEIGTIVPPDGEFFIRPNLDSKSFAGTISNSRDFDDWRKDLLNIKSWTTIPPETEVMIAPLKTIWAEYRCVVINGRYITGSRYKMGSTVAYSSDVGQRIIDYVNERASAWCPREAMVIDVADTPEGLRVIETNAISSSGFYAIDMNLFVGSITALR